MRNYSRKYALEEVCACDLIKTSMCYITVVLQPIPTVVKVSFQLALQLLSLEGVSRSENVEQDIANPTVG